MSFSRQEIEDALAHMDSLRMESSRQGDWNIWAQCLTDDVVFIDSLHGAFNGRRAVADFVVRAHAPFPHLRYQRIWTMIDVEQAEILFHQHMILPEPEGYSGPPLAIDVWSRHRYAGNQLFSLKHDVTLSPDQANATFRSWMKAGGQFLAPPLAPPSSEKRADSNEE